MQGRGAGADTLMDVRQPGAYAARLLPGAKPIPLADLGRRVDELDRGAAVIVYGAIEGRNRIASRMLSG